MTAEDPAALKPRPSKLFVETTTRCNLQCAMCLKQDPQRAFREGDLSGETFAALLPALPTLETLVLSGIGEPLLHPDLEHFIRTAKERMNPKGWVGFQSNGLLMDDRRARGLVEAGLDRICLSVDAASPETYSSIRAGGDLSAVGRALEVLHAARKMVGTPLEIGVEFVLRRDNIRELPETIRWAASRGADFAIVTQLFPYHPSLIPQTVYDANIDASVTIYHAFAKKAEEEGLDLRRYFEVFMKIEKSDADKGIVRLVEEMKADAMGRDVSLNLQALFSMDHTWVGRTEQIFARARRAASQAGLVLKLPEIIPKSTRRCEFVEEGSAFVSWDGRVHPCYFLWHDFRCYISGMEKVVEARAFGDLAEKGILEIWNDPAFTLFRRNVLQYDYPFCFNCSFALCDYVQVGDFKQDCFLKTEPCGVCLWCMDVFQCLK